MSSPSTTRTSPAYQAMLVILLGINMGVVFLDRQAFGLLAPMIQPEFGLNNTQIGMINGILAVTWAFASFGLARLADMTGRSKLLLVLGTLIFSVASISSGLAVGLMTLLAARALMGFAEGGIPPVSTHIVTTEVAPERRGLAIGMLSTIGLNAIPLLGPLLLVGIGTVYGWREAFWVAGIPGLVLAALMALFVRNPTANHPATDRPKGSIIPLLSISNIQITLILATLNMTVVIGMTGFLPLYLVSILGLSEAMMGIVMTVGGIAMVVFGFIGPMMSDRFGRKPIIASTFLITIFGLLLLPLSNGSLPLVFAGVTIAGASMGSSILIMVVIPGESAPQHLRATAMGFNAAIGELLGAGLMPVGIGWAADQIGLGILPWLLVGVSALVCFISLALRETAPIVIARSVPIAT